MVYLPPKRYEPYEPAFDDEEPPFEPVDPDDVENPDGSARHPDRQQQDESEPGANGATTPHVNGHTVVVGGDGGGSAGGAAKKNAVLGLRDKKIPDAKRSTTPYMTKYERARVLGTRALQIRFVCLKPLAKFLKVVAGFHAQFKHAGNLWTKHIADPSTFLITSCRR
jgi:DNA-directed RNA polymerase I, II, and III subunit RPABC2